MEDIIINFKDTGVNEIDADKVLKKWNHLWRISQWHDEYTLVKYKRKDSPNMTLKTRISEEQAKLLINILSLNCEQSPVFRYGKTWLIGK